jgi:streptogramin lyase
MNRHGLMGKRLTMGIGLALISLLVVVGLCGSPGAAAQPARETASSGGASVLYRFNPTSRSFFTIPLSNGALPIGVAVTGTHPAHVWIAEYGLNRITRVIFTGTADYAQTAYPVTSTANSGPFLIALAGRSVWFTERGANRVGRLDAISGQLDEFYGHGLPSNAGLADIAAAPDGSIWVAGQSAKRLYQLTITSTGYAFQEFLAGTNVSTTVGPFGIDVYLRASDPPSSYRIAFASPEGNRIGLLTPGSGLVLIAGAIPRGFAPTDIVYEAARDNLWFGEPGANRIGLSFFGTLQAIPTQLGPITHPAYLSRMVNNTLWLSQQDPAGLLARLVYTSPGVYNFTSYPLPTVGLQPNGVALADDGQAWTAAYRPERIYLPSILRSSGF